MSDKQNPNEHNHILQGLYSVDPVVVIESIEKLRSLGRVSDIPVLVDLLHSSHDLDVKAKISGLLATLKDTAAIPEVIAAIQNPKYLPELKVLVSSCWESGLDYSRYLSLFVDLLIGHDFLVAFEAYTVLMNMEIKIDQQLIDIEIDKLESVVSASNEQKRILILDVIDFLPSIGF